MIKKVVRQVSLNQSEDVSLTDWSLLTPVELLRIGSQLRQHYFYAFDLSDKMDKTVINIRSFNNWK